MRWAAERDKDVTLSWDGGDVDAAASAAEPAERVLRRSPAGAPLVDVVNNVGSIVLTHRLRRRPRLPGGRRAASTTSRRRCSRSAAARSRCGPRPAASVGWFDDDFFLYYEDTDLSWRLRAAGWAIRYEPTAVVRHVHSASSVEWSPTFVFHTDRNRLLMLVKDATRRRWPLREVGALPADHRLDGAAGGPARRHAPGRARRSARTLLRAAGAAVVPAPAAARCCASRPTLGRSARSRADGAGALAGDAADEGRDLRPLLAQPGRRRAALRDDRAGAVADGVEVDLLGHSERRQGRRSPSTSGSTCPASACGSCPTSGDPTWPRCPAEYDLFVNGYLHEPRSRRGPGAAAYLCYFPTPVRRRPAAVAAHADPRRSAATCRRARRRARLRHRLVPARGRPAAPVDLDQRRRRARARRRARTGTIRASTSAARGCPSRSSCTVEDEHGDVLVEH